MEKALKVVRGKETLVSAADVQREFHGRTPWGMGFICPLCRQPLFPAAMTPGGKQSPHFRHERNNERAHECELFASSFGYFTTYQRVPLPLFIRRSRSSSNAFIVEGGFREPKPTDFERLVSECATLVIGRKRYRVTRQRFGGGFTRLPFEEVALNIGSLVRLEGSSLSLGATWGYPEDATRAMVFSRDMDTDQGKRLKIGDTLVFGTDYYLLAPDSEMHHIKSAFPEARLSGCTGNRSSRVKLSVFEVSLTKKDPHWQQAKQYLESCGFEVRDEGDTPKLLWPPALMSNGEILPLFSDSRCVFEARVGSSVDGRLYVHTNADSAEKVRTIPLQKSSSDDVGFAVLKNTANLSFVTTRDWVFSSAVLLHPNNTIAREWLKPGGECFSLISHGEGLSSLRLEMPGTVTVCRRSGQVDRIKVTEDRAPFELNAAEVGAVRVCRPLGASLDSLIVLSIELGDLRNAEAGPASKNPRAVLLLMTAPRDIQRAAYRANGIKPLSSHQLEKWVPTLRSAHGR